MSDYRYIGVKFRRHNKAGVAIVTVTDTTSATQYSQHTIDLYMASLVYGTAYEEYIFWQKVTPKDHEFEIQVIPSESNPNGLVDPIYIEIVEYYEQEELEIPSRAKADAIVWHTDHNEEHTFADLDLTQSVQTPILKTQDFTATGLNTTFTLSGTNRARELYKISEDNGATWFDPWDVRITYGTNSPDFNNELVDSDGYTTVKFVNAPDAGTIKIQYFIKCNKLKLRRTLKHAQDNFGNFIDYNSNVRLLNDAIEVIP